MDLAKVIGSVVATVKYRTLEGKKLAVIQPLDESLKAVSAPLIAVDPESRCGLGEYVYYVAGGDAALLEEGKFIPSDASIVGIVDKVDAGGEFKTVSGGLSHYRKSDHLQVD
jgi:ethanolamine utilization protein EutN